MPPRMMTGSRKAQAASLKVDLTLAPLEGLFDRIVALLGEPVTQRHHRAAAQHARNDAGDEQLHHRGIGHHRIQDHRNRRRDDHRQRGRRRGDGGREFLRVALLLHRRDQDRAHRGDVGDCRSGDLGEEHRGRDVDHREPALDEADQRRCKRDQPSRQAGRIHDRAGQDEQRNRQQRKAGGAGEHHDRRIEQGVDAARIHHRRHRDDAQRNRDRHIEQDQPDHAEKHQTDDHGFTP